MENKHVKAQAGNCELCIHHWLINERNFGVCKKCGETKQFSSGSWYDASIRKNSHTKSSKVSQVVPDTKGKPAPSHILTIEPTNFQPSKGKKD